MSFNKINNSQIINNCCETTCPTTTSPYVECGNPIDYFFKIANLYSINNNTSLLEAINYLLANGLLLSDCGVCCPECVYILGNKEAFEKFELAGGFIDAFSCLNLIDSIFDSPLPPAKTSATGWSTKCCINVYGTYIPVYRESYAGNVCTSCCNNFENCINDLLKHFSENSQQGCISAGSIDSFREVLQKFVDDLIIEQGAFENDQSQVCRILNNLKHYVPDGCFISEFLTFLEKGLVIYCDQSNAGTIYIGNVEKFIQYVNTSDELA
jgi:hypothetical protein